MKQQSPFIYAFILFMSVALISGCSKKEEKEKKEPAQVQVISITPQSAPDSTKDKQEKNTSNTRLLLNCHSDKAFLPEQQLWCQGEAAWDNSQYKEDSENSTKIKFIQFYEQGILDAQSAKDPQFGSASASVYLPIEKSGYDQGYKASVSLLGFVQYSCTDNHKEKTPELEKHWCDAQKLYRKTKLGSDDNIILEDRFIAGYFAGQTIALTQPSSMDTVMTHKESNKALAMKAIGQMSAHASLTEKAFHQGFQEGFSAMMIKVKQSVDQVMKQLQVPEGMGGKQ